MIRLLRLPSLLASASVLSAQVPPPGPPGLPRVPPSAVAVIPADEARVELARVLAYSKNYDESLREYALALAARPDDAALRAERGQVLGWAGRREEAVAELSAVPVAALPAPAAVLLADLILGERKFAEAINLYRRALVLAPDDLPTRFKLARALAWQQRYAESFAEFDRLLAAAPDDVQVRRHRAQVLGWAGRHEEAAAEWKRTLPAAP